MSPVGTFKTGEMIRANPLDRQWEAVKDDVMTAVDRVGTSGRYILGQEVATFERELARFAGLKHAVGCASGLDAIEIGLRALGLRAGEEVLTTPLSAFATTLAILRAGGVPVFVDTDESGLVDLTLAHQYLKARPTLRYFVPVHLFGQPLDLDRLQALKEDHGLRVVEDSAQAIGARFRDKHIGSVGDVTTLSFYPTKNLGALGDGGAFLTDNVDLAEKARCLRDYGQQRKDEHERLGLNSRLDEVHAAVLRRALLPRLEQWTERRREIAIRYLDGLSHPLVRTVPRLEGAQPVWHLFPVLVESRYRNCFCDYLRAENVHVGVHYPRLVTSQEAIKEALYGYHVLGDLDVARRISEQEASLPIHPYLEDGEIGRVIDLVNHWEVP